MQQKIKLFLFLISFIFFLKISAQTPSASQPILLWSNPDGSSGGCMNQTGGNTPVCTTTICLGESICFEYDLINVPDNNDYASNHTSIYFSDGGSIIIENVYYAGPNPTGCVNYTPITTGTINVTGFYLIPFTIIVLPAAPPTLSVNIFPSNPICVETPVCIQSLTNPIINYSFNSTTNIPYYGPPCSTTNTGTFAFPPGNHQIVYTVNAGHTCSNTATYSVSVASMSISLTAITPTNCSYDYCFNVAPTTCSISSLNFEWQVMGPNNYVYTTSGASQTICNTLPTSGTYSILVFTPDLQNPIFQSITVNVPLLTASVNILASPSNTICKGNSVTLAANGATSYTWSTGSNASTISVSPTVTTTYTVIGKGTLGCLATNTITISVLPIPNITVNNPSVCPGSSAFLTASGASSYTWMPGSLTGSVITVNPSTTTVYTITGVNSLGCNSTQTATVTILSLAKIGVAASPSVICYGQNSTLSASGALSYTWNPGAATGSVIIVSPTVTTLYTVSATNSNGCVNTRTISITVNPLPTLSVAASPTIVCLSSSTLSAAGATTYSWSTGTTSSTLAVSPSVTTTYTVIGTNSSGCSSSSTVTVMYGPVSPIITVSSNSNIVCSGSTTLTASGGASYTWSPGNVSSPTIAVSPTVATVYTITSTIGSGCGTYTFTSIVNPQASTLCCNAPNMTVGASLTSSVNMASGTYAVAGTVIDMQGVITFTGNTSFNGYTFRMKPGTLLRVVGEYTLSLINCKLFSCSELWNGISLPALNNDIHGHLLLNNTTVEDMYNGIVVEGNAWPVVTPTTGILISSTNSKLNKNYISIQMRNIDGMFYTPTMSYTSTPYPFSMITTTISSYASATSPGSTLKPSTTYTYAYNTWAGGATSSTNAPFVSFPRTYTGIALNNMKAMSPLIIGDSVNTGNTNTFDNMDFGITGTEATIKVHNNYFKNITGSTKQTSNGETYPAFGPNEIGIAVAMTHTSTNVHSLTVGTQTVIPSGNPYPKGNKFEDCNRGVYAIGCANVYAKANTFSATATSTVPPFGVDAYYYYKNQSAIWINAQADYFTLSYNYIQNFSSGIYSSHTTTNTTMRPHIVKNSIAAPSSTGFCKQAIQVVQVGGSNFISGYVNIDNNSIANVYNGIQAGGVANGIWIKNNSVSVEPKTKLLGTTATAINTAIRVSNSNYAMVQANSVTNSGAVPTTSTTANYIAGIHVSGSTFTKVECNNAYHTGRGFVFEGACGNSSWKVNTMSDSYRGLEMRLAAVIGAQGGTGSPNLSANTWSTLTQHTFVLGTTNVNTMSRLYLLSGGNTQPTLNFGTNSYDIVSGGINVVTGTSYTCNAGNAQRMANGSNGNNTNSGGNNQKTAGVSTDSLTELTNLAMADENSYEVFADEMMYQNKQFVYQLIEQDSINPAKNSTLSVFYNSNQNTAIGKLTEAQIAMSNFDISGASSANSSAPIINAIEQKQQRANELVLKYMYDRNYIFTDNEKTDLKNMANECLAKGDYVTHARNLVDVFTHTTILYEDECEADANASRKTKPDTLSGVEGQTSFNLFPNPNNGIMTLAYDLGYAKEATMQLFDAPGKLISTYILKNNKGSIGINDRNLQNGIYFYSILVKDKVIKNDKIVIIR